MPTSEEGREVLRLLAEKKITAEQALRLLKALGELPGERSRDAGRIRGEGPRMIRIRVRERGKQTVDLAVPLPIARARHVERLASGVAGRFGIDLHDMLRDLNVGRIVDVGDDDDRVEISVE